MSMNTISSVLLRAVMVLAAFGLPSMACSSSKAPHEERVHVTSAPATIDIGSAPRSAVGGKLVLHLDGVQVAEGQAAILRVFVNRPDATAATPTDHVSFVEELFLVPASSTASAPGARGSGQNLVLPLPEGSVKPGERIKVTIVPMRADAQGRLSQPGAADVVLDHPYVTIEP